MYSEAKKRANAKWNAEHMSEYDRIVVLLPRNDKDLKNKARKLADMHGASMSNYICELIEREAEKQGL